MKKRTALDIAHAASKKEAQAYKDWRDAMQKAEEAQLVLYDKHRDLFKASVTTRKAWAAVQIKGGKYE